MTIDKGSSRGLVGSTNGAAGARPGRGKPSAIEFRIDAASGVPTYMQLVKQLEHALRLGYLEPGDEVPHVLDVVALLAINPNTVLNAYPELETKGLAVGPPGQGVFVQATLSQIAMPELATLRRTLITWLASAQTAGLDEDGMNALFTSVMRDFFKTPSRSRTATGKSEGVA